MYVLKHKRANAQGDTMGTKHHTKEQIMAGLKLYYKRLEEQKRNPLISNRTIANELGISVSTLFKWKYKYPKL